MWKPRGSCPGLNGPLLILQMDEDIEVHGVCSSFTSAPSGFTALPRSVVTAGKILLVGFLNFLKPERRGQGGRLVHDVSQDWCWPMTQGRDLYAQI